MGRRRLLWLVALGALPIAMAVSPAAPPGADTTPPAPPDWDAVGREAAGLLQRYVRIRSVNPPADTHQTAEFLAGLLRSEGIDVKTFESAPGKVNLLARLPAARPAGGSGQAAVMLLHHMDVVPVDAARWQADPFGAAIKDGYLHGRGSMDMKGLGVIHLMAFLTLARQRVPLTRDLLLLATADEETGGQDGARWMIANHWDEMRPEYVLDEGGFGARDVLAADGRLVFSVSVAEKKVLWVRLTAWGTAGHGSQPIADNANDRLLAALSGLTFAQSSRSLPRPTAVLDALKAKIGELAANKFTNAIQRDTCSLTTLRSGVGEPPKVNVIPSSAEATVDCRLLPDTDPDRFLASLVPDAARHDVKMEVVYRVDDTPVSPWDTPLFAALERAIVKEHPGAVVAPSLIPYGTDSNVFRVKGARSYGITPMVVDASIIASMHSDNERIPVDQLVRGVRIFYDLLREFCGGSRG